MDTHVVLVTFPSYVFIDIVVPAFILLAQNRVCRSLASDVIISFRFEETKENVKLKVPKALLCVISFFYILCSS